MNYSTAVFLINDKCRAIEVAYEPDPSEYKKSSRTIFKTFDDTIKVGDICTVPSNTRHKITTVKVTAVDIELDPETTEDIKWIIGVVNTAHFEEMKAMEERAISQIKAAQKTHAREELRKKMFVHMDEQTVKALPMANIVTTVTSDT